MKNPYPLAPGQAMIISVLLLSTIMLSLTLVGMSSVIRQLQGNATDVNKSLATRYATACAEVAMDRLGRYPTYGGDEIISIGTASCTIRPVTVGWGWTVETWSMVGSQYTRLRITLSGRAPIRINTWEELSSF